MTDIVILGGARTAIGAFGGALAGVTPIDMGTVVAKAAIARAGIDAGRARCGRSRIRIRAAGGERAEHCG